jgi:hypothetical protein
LIVPLPRGLAPKERRGVAAILQWKQGAFR